MVDTLTPVLSAIWDTRKSWTLKTYEQHDGYQALRQALRTPRGEIVDAVKASGLRGRGGAGLPDRHEVGLPAPGRRPAPLPRGQRRRVRAGDLQGHPAHARQPARARRGRHHLRLRDRGGAGVHLPARRGAARLPPPAQGRGRRARGGVHRHRRARLGLRPGRRRPRRRRRLHLRRGDGAAGLPRGAPRPAAPQAAVPRRRRALRPPDRGQQRGVHRQRPVDRPQRRRLVRRAWAPRSPPATACSPSPATSRHPGQYEAPLGITMRQLLELAGGHARAGSTASSSGPPAGPRRRCSPTSTSTSRSTSSRRWPRPAPCSAPARCRCSTRPRRSCVPCCAGPSSTPTSPAASAPPAARAPTGWCRSCAASRPARAPRRTSTPCWTPATTSSGARSAPSVTGRPAPSPARSSTSARSSSRARHTPARELFPYRASTVFAGTGDDDHERTGRYGMSLSTGHRDDRRPSRRPRPVPLTIDGIEVQAPKGALLIRVAEELGIAIPRFCDHPLLEPAGACRQCLVEVSTPNRDGQLTKMPKPQASCTMTVSPGHGRADPAHVRRGRQGAARRHGAAAGQPPAGLPDLRQGRRVPAAEPGDEQRPRGVPLRRRQAHLRQADQDLHPGPARPRALHPLPALHPVLPGDRRGHVHRPAEAWRRRSRSARSTPTCSATPARLTEGAAELDEAGAPFASYFSGNTIQICPVGALTGAAYRFRARPFDLVSLGDGVRALQLRLRRARRPPPRRRAAPPGRRGPRGQRGVELRQGPLGVHLRHAARPRSRSPWSATR